MNTQDARSKSEQAVSPVRGWSLGPFDTNCYVVRGRNGNACWIVDPGLDPSPVIEAVIHAGLRPEAVILTHAHLDHIAGLPQILRAFPGVAVLGHQSERDWPGDPALNLSEAYGIPISVPGATRFVEDGEELRLGEDVWKVLHTPGHSPGGITLVNDRAGAAIVGDTLFAGSIGRSDFPGSDPQLLVDSIKERLYALPDTTVVYPGHGPLTTIGREKRTNPYVRL